MKLGIIIDSSAGITKAEADKRGWKFLPLHITIDGKEYEDGVDITPKEYYSMINKSMNVRTSATPPGMVIETLKKASKEFEHVLVYPLAKNLSSQNNNIATFAKEFDNVHVIESSSVGSAIVRDLEIIEKNKNLPIEDIIKKANKLSASENGIVVPATMTWLVKGGRVGAGTAGMANMLKIIPMIEFTKDGKLEKFDKGRVFKKTLVKAANALKERYPNGKQFSIYHGGNDDINEIQEIIGEVLGNVNVTYIPPVIGNHVGPGAIAIIASEEA